LEQDLKEVKENYLSEISRRQLEKEVT